MEPKQIHLNISCDEGHVADSLRELASAIENRDVFRQFETCHCCAEIEFPE